MRATRRIDWRNRRELEPVLFSDLLDDEPNSAMPFDGSKPRDAPVVRRWKAPFESQADQAFDDLTGRDLSHSRLSGKPGTRLSPNSSAPKVRRNPACGTAAGKFNKRPEPQRGGVISTINWSRRYFAPLVLASFLGSSLRRCRRLNYSAPSVR